MHPLCFIIHLTQELIMRELDKDSLGKHSILMGQGVTGATHRQEQPLLLEAQAPERNNLKRERRAF